MGNWNHFEIAIKCPTVSLRHRQKMDNLIWTNSKRKISELLPAEYNPRHLTEKQAEDLNKSLENFNLADPLIINQNNVIIGGHQRYFFLKQKGVDEVDVRVPSRQLTDEEEKELNIRLNKNTGEWDLDALANFDEDFLKNIGFDSQELDRIFQLESKPEDDDVPESAPPIAKRGDIYQLGRHRVMCGDSTNADDVALLMDDKKADMVFTDPPYGAKITGFMQDVHAVNRSRHWDMIEGDQFENEELQKFLETAFRNISLNSKDSAPWYVFHAMLTQGFFSAAAATAADLILNRQIIWVKPTLILAFGDYHWRHELCFYGWKKGFKPKFYGDKNETTVWEIDFDGKKRGNSQERLHPTQKPVSLAAKAIQNSSQRDEICVDLFLGSGSTLIACEKTNRICFGMEIDEKYCDVIIKRFVDFTGQKAVKLNG